MVRDVTVTVAAKEKGPPQFRERVAFVTISIGERLKLEGETENLGV